MPVILPLLLEVELDENNLLIENNPYQWATKRNLPNTKVGMIGYSLPERFFGKKLIVLKDEITEGEPEDTFQRIAIPLNRGRKQFLSTPKKFIEHLVRHEIEHCVFEKAQGQEHEADEEALRRMGFVSEKAGF